MLVFSAAYGINWAFTDCYRVMEFIYQCLARYSQAIASFKTLRPMGRSVGISERVNIGTEGLDPGTKALDQGMIFCEKIDFANGLNSYCLNNFYKNASYGKTDNPS